VDNGENSAIDFSGGVADGDGVVCVFVEEEVEKVEQEQETQCTQQNVTQCYNVYKTEYTDSVQESCEEQFVKTCRIVMRERVYNHTTQVCKRPLVKECYEDYGGYAAPGNAPEPQIVCETFYETQCNTSTQATTNGGSPLPVTLCDQVERMICAEDFCRVVEGDEECQDELIENTVNIPVETCSLQPEEVCKNVTVSLPQLVASETCREVPRAVCQTVFTNPRTVPAIEMVKYCTSDLTNTDTVELERQRERIPEAQAQSQRLRQPSAFHQAPPPRDQNPPASFNNLRPDPRIQAFQEQGVRRRAPKAQGLTNQHKNPALTQQNNQREIPFQPRKPGHFTTREKFTRERALRLLGI